MTVRLPHASVGALCVGFALANLVRPPAFATVVVAVTLAVYVTLPVTDDNRTTIDSTCPAGVRDAIAVTTNWNGFAANPFFIVFE